MSENKKNNQYEKIKEITSQLEEGISNIFTSGKYEEWLNTMSKFHDYNLNNTILIAMQRPDATRVAGFNAWKKDFCRSVKKGAKAIKIIAPSPYKHKVVMDKLDPDTKLPVLDKEGNALKQRIKQNSDRNMNQKSFFMKLLERN